MGSKQNTADFFSGLGIALGSIALIASAASEASAGTHHASTPVKPQRNRPNRRKRHQQGTTSDPNTEALEKRLNNMWSSEDKANVIAVYPYAIPAKKAVSILQGFWSLDTRRSVAKMLLHKHSNVHGWAWDFQCAYSDVFGEYETKQLTK